MIFMLKRFLILIGILGVLWFEVTASTDSSVILLEVKGPIGPATVDYVERSLEHSQVHQGNGNNFLKVQYKGDHVILWPTRVIRNEGLIEMDSNISPLAHKIT
jgi:hypothetical protein